MQASTDVVTWLHSKLPLTLTINILDLPGADLSSKLHDELAEMPVNLTQGSVLSSFGCLGIPCFLIVLG